VQVELFESDAYDLPHRAAAAFVAASLRASGVMRSGQARVARANWPDGVSCDLRLRAYAGALGMDEARVVPAAVCLGQLVLVEGADPLQQLELVP
jgi:hypothetical protein